MPATKTLTIADASCLSFYRHLCGADAPVAFDGTKGARVFISDDSDKACIDAHTAGAYIGYSIGRKGPVYRFAYTVSGVVYTIDLTHNEIGHMAIINVVE